MPSYHYDVKGKMPLLIETKDAVPKERVSIMELEGLGRAIWEGIDIDAYQGRT